MSKKVTKTQAEKALAIVAEWLGSQGYGPVEGGPAPTGPEAAAAALGPELKMAWDWPSGGPTPTVILEGGPYEWALSVSSQRAKEFAKVGVFAEPYSGWALCLYREEA